MGENQKRILQMLAEGKINVEEASRLLSLVGEERGKQAGAGDTGYEAKSNPRYLYVRVEPKEGSHLDAEHGRVNVRIPVGLIRAGMKFKALIPPQAADNVNRALNEKGINFDIRNVKDEYIEQLIGALSDTEINVDTPDAEVRIYAE
jgi:hypothetical protein